MKQLDYECNNVNKANQFGFYKKFEIDQKQEPEEIIESNYNPRLYHSRLD
jgi:hypothetical protein